jgi:flagellar biosynthesis/type III secretory pathway protein FliH
MIDLTPDEVASWLARAGKTSEEKVALVVDMAILIPLIEEYAEQSGREAYDEGYDDGKDEGSGDGYDEGFNNGYERGFEEGRDSVGD